MSDLLTIPLDAVEADALPRDRTGLDAEAFHALRLSILTGGLRQPIEVRRAGMAGGAPRYALVSGYRRFRAFESLRDEGHAGFDAIPAFVADLAPEAAFRAMVEENEIRENLSPWERALAIVTAVETAGLYPTLDAAVNALHRGANRMARSRLRAMAEAASAFEGRFTDPERLTQSDLLRLADALRAGYADVLGATLDAERGRPLAAQRDALRPYLAEAAADLAEEAAHPDRPRRAPGRPKRVVRIRCGVMVRREKTPGGWLLRFTGRDATPGWIEEVVDEVERLFGSS